MVDGTQMEMKIRMTKTIDNLMELTKQMAARQILTVMAKPVLTVKLTDEATKTTTSWSNYKFVTPTAP